MNHLFTLLFGLFLAGCTAELSAPEIVGSPESVTPTETFTVEVDFADGADELFYWSLDGQPQANQTTGTVSQSEAAPTQGS